MISRKLWLVLLLQVTIMHLPADGLCQVGNSHIIDKGSLEPGLYFYDLQQNDVIIGKGKLVILE